MILLNDFEYKYIVKNLGMQLFSYVNIPFKSWKMYGKFFNLKFFYYYHQLDILYNKLKRNCEHSEIGKRGREEFWFDTQKEDKKTEEGWVLVVGGVEFPPNTQSR